MLIEKKLTLSQLRGIMYEAIKRYEGLNNHKYITESFDDEEDEGFSMDKDHFEHEIIMYLQNERELYSTAEWMVKAMAKKLKRGERISLEHLKQSSSVKKLTTDILKLFKENYEGFDIKLVQGLSRGEGYSFVREVIAKQIIEDLKDEASYNDYDMSLIQESRENESYPKNATHFFQRIGSDFFDYLETEDAYDDLSRFLSDVDFEDEDSLTAFGLKKIADYCFKNWLNDEIARGKAKPLVDGKPLFDFMRKEYIGNTRKECYNIAKYFMKYNDAFKSRH